jgi:hypothetical protein
VKAGAQLALPPARRSPIQEATVNETVRRGIPTVYAGIEFRSRLEARWAAFFDEIGWRWSYEPFDAAGYIPDFLIHGARPMLVEVKPFHHYEQWEPVIERVRSALVGSWLEDILYLGVEPNVALHPQTVWEGVPALGLLDEGEAQWYGPHEWALGGAHFGHCATCGTKAVLHSTQSFTHRPCDHYHGGHTPPGWDWRQAWAGATNAVKWAGR